VVGLACVALLVACGFAVQHPVPGGPFFEGDDVRFVAPTGWELQPATTVPPGLDQIVVYVANQPLQDECQSDGQAVTCGSPLVEELRPGGILVAWAARSCVAKSCDLPGGTLIQIGNRQGVRVDVDQGCEETGFSERSAYYVTVTPQRVDILLTCARDPSDATRSSFLGFLDAIRWRIP
jgi:hypothetical protein